MATSRARSTRSSITNGQDSGKSLSRSTSKTRPETPSSQEKKNDDSPKKQLKLTPHELRARLFRVNVLGFGLASVFAIGVGLLAHADLVRFYPKHMNSDMLKGFSARADYALRYQVLQIFWLIFNSFFLIYAKFVAYRLIMQPKSSSSQEFQIQQKISNIQAILSNSFEQTMISCFAQLIFVSFADKLLVLKFIPLVNILQFFSRVAYFVGSPSYPSVGSTLSHSISSLLVFYGLYKWGSFVKIY